MAATCDGHLGVKLRQLYEIEGWTNTLDAPDVPDNITLTVDPPSATPIIAGGQPFPRQFWNAIIGVGLASGGTCALIAKNIA